MKNEKKQGRFMPKLTLPEGLFPALLPWYRINARDLPWRHTRDVYQIWLSEIMLQQTRVNAVLSYYERFLNACPTVEDLAALPDDALMKLWEGLGYYSRARNLKKAAAEMAAHGVPRDAAGLLKLPGIGPYTASAIAAAAYGERTAAVDGNVLRVVSRLADLHENILAPAVKEAVTAAVEAVLPETKDDMRISNQAMMELGATLCGPNAAPECGACPLAGLCLARERGTAESLPLREKKPPRREEDRTVFVLLRDGETALRKRGAGLLSGLWEFPNVPGALTEAEAAAQMHAWGLTAREWRSKRAGRHIFTHITWHLTVYCIAVTGAGGDDWTWTGDLGTFALPSAFQIAREAAEEALI